MSRGVSVGSLSVSPVAIPGAFIHLLIQQMFIEHHHMPGPVLSAGGAVMNKTVKDTAFIYVSWGGS